MISRRDFLKVSFTAGGALLIGAYLEACAPPEATEPPVLTPTPTDTPTPDESPFQPNLFIKIDPQGNITLTIHRSEMGQGVRTSLAMILSEELEADWSSIHVEQMDAVKELNQITSGSGSIAINYKPLREAGAMAREMLIAAAAQTWGMKPSECKAEAGTVIHTASGKKLGYGELIRVAKDLKLTSKARTKDPSQFKLIGTSTPRIDGLDIVTGKAIYGLDVRLPGMLFATIARCPVQGGSVASLDSIRAEAVPGVHAVVSIERGVAVVAENTWAAIQGRAALDIQWNEGPNAGLSTDSIRQQLADAMEKDIANEQPSALTTLEAVYETPFLAHATMEPVNCVADVRLDRCEIWAPTQNPQDVQIFVQRKTGLPTDVHVTLLGGGFGRRLEVDYATEAAEVSKAIGSPVQVVWTRDDDIQHDFYRQITRHWMKAGWDETGKLKLWRHYIAAPGINGIAYQEGKDVLDEGLMVLYDVEDNVSRSYLVSTPVPTGPWRGVISAPNAFANECFLDEIATKLKKDPYELRMEMLTEDNPLREVIQLAATKANWGTPLPEGHGRGIGSQIYHKSMVVMVAEVSINDGTVRVHKVVCAINCGKVINPDMVVQQVEGSIVYSLTSILKGEITHANGRVQQSNFHDYPLLQLNEMPEVDVYVVPSERAPQGLGEMGVPPIVPAVVNAIYAATGKRIRHTPIRAEDL